VDYAGELAPEVLDIYSRLASSNAEDWYVLDDQSWKIENFLTAVDQAYRVYLAKVKGVPVGAPAPAAPSAPAGGPLPSPAPAGRATASKPAPRGGGGAGIMPPSKVLGIPTKTLLVGGGLAAAAGILYLALS
jgi:hypothetical protein